MSEKRYFKMEYDEEWYLFDSTIISEQLVKEQAEYGYGVFADSLSPSEIVDLLNGQESIIISLKKRNEQLGRIVKMSEKRFSNLEIVKNLILLDDNDKFTVFTEKTLCNLLNELNDENEQLRQSRDYWCKSAKLHSKYFNCLEKAIERAYEEKPYPTDEDINRIYAELEKEIDDE